jgi:hypothetical protein
MKSLVFMSVFFAMLLIPVLTGRGKNPRRGVKRIMYLLAFNALYVA